MSRCNRRINIMPIVLHHANAHHVKQLPQSTSVPHIILPIRTRLPRPRRHLLDVSTYQLIHVRLTPRRFIKIIQERIHQNVRAFHLSGEGFGEECEPFAECIGFGGGQGSVLHVNVVFESEFEGEGGVGPGVVYIVSLERYHAGYFLVLFVVWIAAATAAFVPPIIRVVAELLQYGICIFFETNRKVITALAKIFHCWVG
mmetsp:Transcript_37266/g.68999  ORF Transcript_37266/g.68999 Transcript_37266/m.68999 type:complete len:200 (+) Transcript_37266:595-1194(+)